MNFKLIIYVLSTMSLTAGAALVPPLILAKYYGEPTGGADFLVSILICLLVSFELRSSGEINEDDVPSLREGIAITGLGWLMLSVLGMLPYFLSGYMQPLDCFVESVSGFTGTGATVVEDLDIFPRSILLWRSLTNWIGGLGIIVIFMAILPQMKRGAMYMFQAEATGPTKDRQLPQIRNNAKALFGIYVFFTGSCMCAYMLFGLGWFEALNHALSTIATGGFSIYNDGVNFYHNPGLEFCMVFFMILSSGSFSMYLLAFRNGTWVIWKNTEFRVFLMILGTATVLIVVDLLIEMEMDWLEALRYTVFHVASLSSTTAFVTYDFASWPGFSRGILLILMFIGGCAGSTSGGLKVSRVVLLLKMVESIVWQKLHPQIIYHVKLNGRPVPDEVLYSAGRFFFAYLMIDILFAIWMTFDGVPFVEAVSVAISTMGNVGPGFGLDGAMSTYALLPTFSKVGACIVMILGRLEIFTVIALLMPEFWRRSKGW